MLFDIADHIRERPKRRIVGFWDVDAQPFVDAAQKIQPVHGVEIDLIAQPDVVAYVIGFDFGGNGCQHRQDHTTRVFFGHRTSLF